MKDTDKDLAMRESAGLGRPLRVPAFRNLLIADLVSDIGTFMQNVGAAWLMISRPSSNLSRPGHLTGIHEKRFSWIPIEVQARIWG